MMGTSRSATGRPLTPVLVALPLLLLGACGANAASDVPLSAAGEAGRKVANTNGCGACHGSQGEGGVGPALVGLLGRTIELDDGTTVVADEAYVRESITDPSVRKVAGYQIPMPTNNLSPDEVDAVVAYIRDLSAAAGATSDGSDAEEAP